MLQELRDPKIYKVHWSSPKEIKYYFNMFYVIHNKKTAEVC